MKAIDRSQLVTLLDDAHIKPRIKRELRFVPEEVTDWDNRDFLAVMNRSRSEGVLLLPFEKMSVVPFQLHPRQANKAGRVEAIICDFCATWQRGSNSAVISIQRAGSTASFLCCADLDCSLHIRSKTPESVLSRTQLRENNSIEDRIERLRLRLSDKLEL
jgi:hypothetical protein